MPPEKPPNAEITKLLGSMESSPIVELLNRDEQREYFRKVLDLQLAASKDLQETAIRELKAGIKKAKTTQSVILVLNIIMFFFGMILISVAVYGGFTNMNPVYGILFGGVGFADLVATFFIGAMQRSQKSISDLVQIEIAFLNYFEQVALWEQYAAVRNEKGKVHKENLAEAATKIQASTAQTLELLQKYVEATTQ